MGKLFADPWELGLALSSQRLLKKTRRQYPKLDVLRVRNVNWLPEVNQTYVLICTITAAPATARSHPQNVTIELSWLMWQALPNRNETPDMLIAAANSAAGTPHPTACEM
jgi:hypothetical protein